MSTSPFNRFGFICSEEQILAVQRRPRVDESRVIDEYVVQYTAAFGHPPHGMHYLPVLGAVWLPPAENSPATYPELTRVVS